MPQGRPDFVLPFQGWLGFAHGTQGDALGWYGAAPLGRRKDNRMSIPDKDAPRPKPPRGDSITAQGSALGSTPNTRFKP